ncbi:MAG: single-stranded-DNA-specific exonuclease RecJ [Patescibacteria group bacterium]
MFSLREPLGAELRDVLKEYDDLSALLLAGRGITSSEDAEVFLSPSYDAHIHDPMLIKNMPVAAARLAKAIETKEKIAVWSDYDCDGIPGGVLLHDFLKKAKANFVNYIPHRHDEGYGVNKMGLEKLRNDGVSLVVTVDSGIVDNEAVAYGNSLGLEIIVTDHHEPQDELPPALAVIDPKQEGETYPFRELCGAGLAWKLACATLQRGWKGREEIPPGWEKWLLDMAGLATIADMVPLVGENRVIARYGLLVMRKSPRLGFQKLCRVARVNQRSITEDDVGFMIAPRVNAASRMGNPMDAFRLFTTEDEVEADELAKLLEKINRSRRAMVGSVTRAVHERLSERETIPDVIVMGDPEWRPGLLGLVANSLAEEYSRPVFLWGKEGSGIIKGSCRAGRKSVNVVDLMSAAGDVLIQFGGHSQSGGFSVRDDAVFFLEENLCAALAAVEATARHESVLADAELAPDHATHDLLRRLERFAPFGMGNPKPVFALRNVEIESVSWFGKSGEHLKIRIVREFGTPLEGVCFYAKRELGIGTEFVATGTKAQVLGSLELDQFSRGRPVRLRLVSIV